MAGTGAGQAVFQTMQNQQNKVPGIIQQIIEQYFGSEAEQIEFSTLHAKAAYLGQPEIRWRGKQWPVTLDKNAAEAVIEKNDKYYSSEVVIELVRVICELRSALNYLTSQNINTLGTGSGVIHWQDLELKGTLKALLDSSCFKDNPCGGDPITTLGDLLETIISKLCCVIAATNSICP
jgi:hypothetical protein